MTKMTSIDERAKAVPIRSPTGDDFLGIVRSRLAAGAKTIGIAERHQIDPRDAMAFAQMIREELADVAAYAKLLDDRMQAIARVIDAWEHADQRQDDGA